MRNKPIITQTEILVFAIRHLEDEIEDMKKRCEGRQGVQEILENFISDREPKIEALKQLYHIQTGSEFC